MYTSRALFIAAVFLAIGHGAAQFPMRWCTKSNLETNKCDEMKDPMERLASDNSMNITFTCVQGTSAANCMEKIKNGQADLITLDGGEINTAGEDLVPVVGEDYGAGYGISYKAVAVVKAENKDIKFTTLKGKKSCHTGAGKTAGWNVPIGTLLRKGIMKLDESCNAYVAASKFFDKSCVPRVKEVNQGNSYDLDNLCALCRNECTTAIKGEYSDYDGAFRCLQAGVGDVAFIKHTTVGDNTQKPGNYKYLCLDGTTNASPDNCFLAKVPSHAVVTKRAHDRYSSYQKLLVKASEKYGVTQTNSSMFQLFNSSKYNGKNLLFKDSTKKLVDVGDQNTYKKWLGDVYLEDLKALNMCPYTSKATTVGSHPNKPQLFVAMVFFFAMVISGVLFE